MRVTIVQEGMTVDLLVWQVYGRQDEGVVEQVLAANPGLAAMGAVLPVGATVTLPDPTPRQSAKRNTVRLWS